MRRFFDHVCLLKSDLGSDAHGFPSTFTTSRLVTYLPVGKDGYESIRHQGYRVERYSGYLDILSIEDVNAWLNFSIDIAALPSYTWSKWTPISEDLRR